MIKKYCDRCGVEESTNLKEGIFLRHFECVYFNFDLCMKCFDDLENNYLEFRNVKQDG